MQLRIAFRIPRLLLGTAAVATLFLASPSFAFAQPHPQQAASSQSSAAPAQQTSAPASGPEACKTCHEQEYDAWEKSPHWKTTLDTKGGHEKQGCEGCHGSATEHLADPSDTSKLFLFEKASAKDVTSRCLTCHAGGAQHMNALNSVHTENGVSCISCHSPHHAASKEFLLIKSQPELCYGCHLAKKAEFNMPFHHRVNEGLIQCSDCHNVHGTAGPKQVRASASQDAVCFKCHTDKQGPFVYEHPPMKVDGCTSCHTVHGGPNAHMLRVSNVNLLCLQCHTDSSFSGAPGAPSFHNQASFFQACPLCHASIHGSNASPFFFK